MSTEDFDEDEDEESIIENVDQGTQNNDYRQQMLHVPQPQYQATQTQYQVTQPQYQASSTPYGSNYGNMDEQGFLYGKQGLSLIHI